MKLNIIVIVILGFSILFVTNQAYAPCIEGPGNNCNNYLPPALTQISTDKLNYKISDKPIVTITGASDAIAHLEIDDPPSNIIFTHDISLSPNGTVKYVLDISAYKPGVYSIIATSPISKLTTSFAVGLTTTGPIVTLNVLKDTYVQGDFIPIIGTVGPNDTVQLSLIDPNDNVIASIQTVSNNVGQYSTSALMIPTNAISGIWKITADHNISHTALKIMVQSSISNGVMKSNDPVIITLESPLKQFKSGIAAKDVKCNQGLELLTKSYDNMPACVKSTSIQRLLEQGWINPYNFNGKNIDKESISLLAYQGVSKEAFYNNGTVASDFTINVNINNFKPSNASLILQVYYDDGTLYKTITVSSDSIQPDGFYKYHLITVSDKNHPPPFKVVATYNNETAIAYAPVFAHP